MTTEVSDEKNSSKDELSEEVSVEIKLCTQLKNSQDRSHFIFDIVSIENQIPRPFDKSKILTELADPKLQISSIRFSLEWLSPHYFSWLGQAPAIEDFIHFNLSVANNHLTIRYGGDNLSGSQAPIKDIAFWDLFSTALSPLKQ